MSNHKKTEGDSKFPVSKKRCFRFSFSQPSHAKCSEFNSDLKNNNFDKYLSLKIMRRYSDSIISTSIVCNLLFSNEITSKNLKHVF